MALANLALILCLVLPGFVLEGGHLHVLLQPFNILITLGMYFGYYVSMLGLRPARSVLQADLWEVGKAALWPAALLPMILGAIHTLAYLDQSPITIGEHIAAAMTAPIYSFIVFGAFFRPSILPPPKHPRIYKVMNWVVLGAFIAPLAYGFGIFETAMTLLIFTPVYLLLMGRRV